MQGLVVNGLFPSLAACCVFSLLQVHVNAIGCFVCSSINGSEPSCEDTFNNTSQPSFYDPYCKSGRKGRSGLFPGTQCIKMKAEKDGYTVIVRKCVVDDGGINSDTEMGRESHCWMVNMIKFNDRHMYGCSLTCMTDGCNTARQLASTSIHLIAAAGILLAAILTENWPFS